MLHIYRVETQPATDWIDTNTGEPRQMGWAPDELIYARCCNKQRPAKDCVVQSSYSVLDIWCAAEKGCNAPEVIAAKKALAFANRSAGQKARWAKVFANKATGDSNRGRA